MAPEPISVERASKRYGAETALRGISFEIAAGEAVGYLGPNGAGKTTTLRLLSGLTRPDSGSVRLMGLDPALLNDRALRHVGVLVETPGVVPYVTARDLLSHVARVKRVPPTEASGQIRALAERLGFLAQLDRPIGTLSTGLTRRVLLAVALVGDPQVILLDEPTLGLDPAARADLRAILRGLRSEGRTLLLSTDLLDDVEEVCTRVLFLRDGQLVGDEPVVPPGDGGPSPATRVLALGFAADVTTESIQDTLGKDVGVARAGPRSVIVRFAGDEPRQAELLGTLVRRGLPLMTAADARPSLAERYMQRVGREDPE